MTHVDTAFIAIGANRNPTAADWSPSGLLAFGAGRCIALWNPLDSSHRGVHATLKGHADRVNVVRFLPSQPQDADILLTGSVDKSVRVWTSTPDGFNCAWASTDVHKGSINAIATCAANPNIFASADASGTIAVFSISVSGEGAQVIHLQSFSTAPKFYPLTLALSTLPSSPTALLLAVAGSASSISLYIAPSASEKFTPQATLSGHENWIRSLVFTPESPDGEGDLILASASQDKYIRLWRVHAGEALPPATANDETKTYGLSNRLSNKAHKLRTDGGDVWSVTFEALLMGHEDWIYTTSWRPAGNGLQLLSASADSSLSIWTPEPESGIWLTTSRLGEISDTKGASTATGSVGGLWTGLWSPSGNTVAAFGKTGSWRLWHHDESSDRWLQGVGISGHVKEAMGVSWGKGGGYLLSTGLDQTTRLFSKWARDNQTSWHEFARPQIHGYDINAVVDLGKGRFISGAEEKLLRVFDEPKGVAGMLERMCGLKEESLDSMPDAANVPVLGLSNKAIDDDAPPTDLATTDPDALPASVPEESGAAPSSGLLDRLNHPPLEDHLCRHTLWPEHEKLYGHGYEISAVAASDDGSVVATACKASTGEHAVIRLYETAQWREVKPSLAAHVLTVTSLAFAPGGRKLLSVGRDRTWAVFENTGGSGFDGDWKLIERKEKGHARMILDGKWAPMEDIFATGGRDKMVRVWCRREGGWECTATLKFEVPVTAVDFYGTVMGGKCVLAVGLEDGGLEVYKVGTGGECAEADRVLFDQRVTPDKAVTQITWCPSEVENGKLQMAVTSEDGSVRIYGLVL